MHNPKTPAELEAHIMHQGCFAPEKNKAIYERWFRKSPRYLFKALERYYPLRTRRLCDVGCSYGMNLVYCTHPDSYGIEIIPECAQFAQSLGLKVYARDMVKESVADLPKVDIVWCCAVLEHVDAPHVFLRKLWTLLDTDGLLAIYVPTIPPIWSRWLRWIRPLRPYFINYGHSDHVNAFTPDTLKFACERAGFETVEMRALYPGPLSFFDRWLFALDGVMYIGKKTAGPVYVRASTRKGRAEYFDEKV